MALFFTGREHAGENLGAVLAERAADLPAPMQMCDALSRNTPKLNGGVELLVANCLTHYLDSGVIQSDGTTTNSWGASRGGTCDNTSTPLVMHSSE